MENKKSVEKVNSTSIGSVRAYFMRGHSGYLLLSIWALSNITILYVLLGGEEDWLYQIFPNIIMFGVVFVIGYASLCVIIGYIDIKVKGIYGAEQEVYWQAVPTFRKLVKGAKDIIEVKESIEEIKSILGQLIATVNELLKDKESTLESVMLEEVKFEVRDINESEI